MSKALFLAMYLLLVAGAVGCGSATAATATPRPLPAPEGFEALTVHDRLTIQLTWQPYSEGGASLVIERSVSQDSGPWQELAVVSSGDASYMDSGLTDGTVYYYRMKARTAAGVSPFTPVVHAEATDLPRPPAG